MTRCLDLGEDTSLPAEDARAGNAESELGPRQAIDDVAEVGPGHDQAMRRRFGLAVAQVDGDMSETALLGGKKLRPERPSRRQGDF